MLFVYSIYVVHSQRISHILSPKVQDKGVVLKVPVEGFEVSEEELREVDESHGHEGLPGAVLQPRWPFVFATFLS